MRIERFEDIEAWQLARELTSKVYGSTKKTMVARNIGLKGQIQDAAGSSMHNIAERFGAETNSEVTVHGFRLHGLDNPER
jgi:four helix bundle protein